MMARTGPTRRATPGLAKPEKVADLIERDILSGKLANGSRLESENQLVRRFSVSRATVRKGLETLAVKGLITTRMGIGSFVTFGGEVLDNRLGWTRALARRGETIETRLIRLEAVRDPDLANRLGRADDRFIAIDRTRLLAETGVVMSIERSRVPAIPALADLPARGLDGGSLSQTLKAAGLVGDHGEEWAEIECLSEADAALVGKPPGTPFLRARRLVRADDGSLVEYVVSLLDPAHFALHLAF